MHEIQSKVNLEHIFTKKIHLRKKIKTSSRTFYTFCFLVVLGRHLEDNGKNDISKHILCYVWVWEGGQGVWRRYVVLVVVTVNRFGGDLVPGMMWSAVNSTNKFDWSHFSFVFGCHRIGMGGWLFFRLVKTIKCSVETKVIAGCILAG